MQKEEGIIFKAALVCPYQTFSFESYSYSIIILKIVFHSQRPAVVLHSSYQEAIPEVRL